jgi:4-hydroxybenzoate polyprenyltransferase
MTKSRLVMRSFDRYAEDKAAGRRTAALRFGVRFWPKLVLIFLLLTGVVATLRAAKVLGAGAAAVILGVALFLIALGLLALAYRTAVARNTEEQATEVTTPGDQNEG